MTGESERAEFLREFASATPEISTFLSNEIVKRTLAYNQGKKHSLDAFLADIVPKKYQYPHLSGAVQALVDTVEKASVLRLVKHESVKGIMTLLQPLEDVIVREFIADIFLASLFDNPAEKLSQPTPSISELYTKVFQAFTDERGKPLPNEQISHLTIQHVVGALLLEKILLPSVASDRERWWKHVR